VSDRSAEKRFRDILLRRDADTHRCAICGIPEGERSLDAGHINGKARFNNLEYRAKIMMDAADLVDPHLPTNGVLLCHDFCHYVFDAFFLSVRVGDSAEEVVDVSEELQAASPAYKALHGQPLFLPSRGELCRCGRPRLRGRRRRSSIARSGRSAKLCAMRARKYPKCLTIFGRSS